MSERWRAVAGLSCRARVAVGLVVLLGLPGPAFAARKALTPLEREVQAWIKAHPASPKLPVALEMGLNQGLLVPNLFLRIDVSPSGEVAYIGRTLTGLAVEINRRALLDPRSTPAVQFLGFDIEDSEGNFKLSVSGRVGWTGVHVHFPRGTQPQAEDLIGGLAEVVDFGADYDRLQNLRRAYDSLERQIATLGADSAESARERLSAAEGLVRLLQEALENRRSRSRIFGVPDANETTLASRLSELEKSINPLQQEEIAELGAVWAVLRERLRLAEIAFHAHPLKLDQQIEAARDFAGIARAAHENRSEFSSRTAGGNELGGLEALTNALEVWRAGAERAQERGCPWDEPISEAKVLSLLEIPAPDLAIAGELHRCGVSFRPDRAILLRLANRGLGSASRTALREEAFRPDRSQVPKLAGEFAESTDSTTNAKTAVADSGAPNTDFGSRPTQLSPQPRTGSTPIAEHSLLGISVEVVYEGMVEPKAEQVAARLRALGARVELRQDVVDVNLRYNHVLHGECNREVATAIRSAVADVARFSLKRSVERCPSVLMVFVLS